MVASVDIGEPGVNLVGVKIAFFLFAVLFASVLPSSGVAEDKLFWIGGEGGEADGDHKGRGPDPTASTIRLSEGENRGGGKNSLSVKNSVAFRAWVAELCESPAVEAGLSERRKSTSFNSVVQRPSNALGSLLLLLENYENDITYVNDCREQRKTLKTACKAPGLGPIPGRTIIDHPAAAKESSDLLLVHKGAARKTQEALQKTFSALVDVGGLDGSLASVERARKIRHAAEFAATCKIRAISTSQVSHSPFGR